MLLRGQDTSLEIYMSSQDNRHEAPETIETGPGGPRLLDVLGQIGLLEGFAGRSAIVTTLDVAEDLGRLPADIETALFRVVQESLGNIHRHSGSTTAAIRIRRDAGTVRLDIRDEGGGLTPALRQGIKEMTVGVGIAGMRERMRKVGGRLEIESSDRGTTVRAIVPLPRNARPENIALSGQS
jgi:two-component system NarL family sensor kinase